MIDFTRFVERYEQFNASLPHSENITESRINDLYLRVYEPMASHDEVLIVYHGGGVNSDAGYDILARQLSYALPICIFLVDIRGHGRSAGVRGEASSPDQIWRDVDSVIDYVRTSFPDARIHLLGHSSGGGMLINYFTRHSPSRIVESLILLAPALGPFSPPDLNRDFSSPFASINRLNFIINAMSGGFLYGRRAGVRLNFPCEVINARPDFVQTYSVNMANALTPRNPQRQLKEISIPVTILLAEHDELFNVSRMDEFLRNCCNPNVISRIVAGSTHLDCIFELTDMVREHLTGLTSRAQ
ncbi:MULTISPECIES: alpha/beta fold hydrolase [Citrobacter]|uniref:Lysophospholipase n=1 Tax=Citrobacter pasteurii TaxID=1563222 RepID=A0ABX8K2C2_9ENTR|nr:MULTISPECIES: alpha/beta fold hydrolase [Citrobacter]EIQ79878.1 alpha/beta hydrolase fold family protein [Shigella flexneri 1235-66]MBD0802722.1 alpha/beta fold hydrolase [Citrobacter sp. C6_1]MBD0811640.1 alpha/beta fold hydrolase [Citrobacter sp. C6_2]MBA4711752.1 alpha/beta fold hydrolase [Citrobacter pasteurii]QXA43199.1 lysophospholipase [Citrobacter pasteurii]